MGMNFQEWLDATSPEVLEKLAEIEQDRLVLKVIDQLIPIMEKQAEYTAYLIMNKFAEEQEQVEQEQIQEQGLPIKPASGAKDNIENDPVTKSPPGLPINEIIKAIEEAIQVGQPDKIVALVKAIASKFPEAIDDVIKIVKVELQDAGMKRFISLDDAAKIAQELNVLAEGDQKGQEQ